MSAHLRRAWAVLHEAYNGARFQHVYLPADPHEAYTALTHLSRTASRRTALEDHHYDHARLADVIAEGGFSHHPTHGTPDKGYMVSHDDDGSGIATVHHVSELTPEHIAAHREASAHLLKNPNTFQGGWHDTDDGQVYLDVSRHHHDEHEARKFAVEQRQKAYFNTHTFDTHYLSPRHDPLALKDHDAWSQKYAPVGHDAPEGYGEFAHRYPASQDLKDFWSARGHHIARAKGKYDGEPMGPWRSPRWVEQELARRAGYL